MKVKNTKIVATISDKNCSVPFVRSLFEAGMNVVRINSAHLMPEQASRIVASVRAVSDTIAILIDTKGPEIRLTATADGGGIGIKTGDTFLFGGDPTRLSSRNTLYVNYLHFTTDVPAGASILIDDGDISFSVVDKKDGFLHCVACNDGIVYGRKSVNVPNVPIQLPSLSEKDKQFLYWAMEQDIDFVAHSFVRNREDVLEVQSVLDSHDSHIKVIAKIENQQGVDHVDEILEVAYGIMVARGDLGVEIEAEKIPVIQRKIIGACRIRKKPVIIATQMLHTMIEHPRPTRAEVSDVANAVYQRADAIMLSGETANGKYPVEAVETMARIARAIEPQLAPTLDLKLFHVTEPVAAVLAESVVGATTCLDIKAIVMDTLSGRTGRYLSAFRPQVPIYAKCYKAHVVRELALSYGVTASLIEMRNSKDDFIQTVVESLLAKGRFTPDDLIAIVAGSFGFSAGATFMEVSTAKNMTK